MSRKVVAIGLYQMTDQDKINGTRFADGISHSGYFIDGHNPAGSTDQYMNKCNELKIKSSFIPKEYYEVLF